MSMAAGSGAYLRSDKRALAIRQDYAYFRTRCTGSILVRRQRRRYCGMQPFDMAQAGSGRRAPETSGHAVADNPNPGLDALVHGTGFAGNRSGRRNAGARTHRSQPADHVAHDEGMRGDVLGGDVQPARRRSGAEATRLRSAIRVFTSQASLTPFLGKPRRPCARSMQPIA